MTRIERSTPRTAKRRNSVRARLPLAPVLLFTMMVPSMAAADPIADSPASVVAIANGDLRVLSSGTACPDDGDVNLSHYSPMGSGSDYSGLVLGLNLWGFLSTEGAPQQFLLCGAVKPAAGKSSADCREFAATLRGTRELQHWVSGEMQLFEVLVDEFEAELTAIALGVHSSAVSLTGTYTRYREDGTATGETGEIHLVGRAEDLNQPACDPLNPRDGWYYRNWLTQGFELSETSG